MDHQNAHSSLHSSLSPRYFLFSRRHSYGPALQMEWTARDLAIEAHKSLEYAYEDMSAKPFDPNDKSTWPTAKDDIHKFEKTIETVHPSGHVDRVHYKVDPNSPADIAAAAADQAKHYLRQRMMREPNSPEAQAFFLAEDAEIRRESEDAVRLREAALTVEHARLQPQRRQAPRRRIAADHPVAQQCVHRRHDRRQRPQHHLPQIVH